MKQVEYIKVQSIPIPDKLDIWCSSLTDDTKKVLLISATSKVVIEYNDLSNITKTTTTLFASE